jgi:hypothetical protein
MRGKDKTDGRILLPDALKLFGISGRDDDDNDKGDNNNNNNKRKEELFATRSRYFSLISLSIAKEA